MKINERNKSESTSFKSSDFYLCCFLVAKGAVVIDIDKTNPRRSVFMFEDSPELQQDVEDFFNQRASINPRTFASAIKDVKQQLYAELP